MAKDTGYHIFYESIPHSPAGFYFEADANGVLLLSHCSQAKLDDLARILNGTEPCKEPFFGTWEDIQEHLNQPEPEPEEDDDRWPASMWYGPQGETDHNYMDDFLA